MAGVSRPGSMVTSAIRTRPSQPRARRVRSRSASTAVVSGQLSWQWVSKAATTVGSPPSVTGRPAWSVKAVGGSAVASPPLTSRPRLTPWFPVQAAHRRPVPRAMRTGVELVAADPHRQRGGEGAAAELDAHPAVEAGGTPNSPRSVGRGAAATVAAPASRRAVPAGPLSSTPPSDAGRAAGAGGDELDPAAGGAVERGDAERPGDGDEGDEHGAEQRAARGAQPLRARRECWSWGFRPAKRTRVGAGSRVRRLRSAAMAPTITPRPPAPVPRCRARGLWVALAAGAVVAVYAVVTGGHAPQPRRARVPAGTVTFPETRAQPRRRAPSTTTAPRPPEGNHNPIWLNCGVYTQPVVDVNAVHSLEHGAVWITYLPSLPAAGVARLRHTVEAHYGGGDRYVILSPYPGQPAPVMATAWGNQLSLQSPTDPRVAAFIEHFREGPQDLERGAPCSGGVGKPAG